jgi:hypothetical protein
MLYPPIVPYVLKLWQLVVRCLSFVKEKAQELFDFFMNKLVTWLCRYYLRDAHGYY